MDERSRVVVLASFAAGQAGGVKDKEDGVGDDGQAALAESQRCDHLVSQVRVFRGSQAWQGIEGSVPARKE